MPPVKLSRILYVPKTPKKGDQGDPGDLTVDGQAFTLPDGALHADIDKDVMEAFLDAIDTRNVKLEDALERALTLYTARLQSVVKPPTP